MADTGAPRRTFLGLLTSLVMGILCLLVAIPAVAYFLGPLRRKPGEAASLIDVGAIADFPEGEWRLHALEMVHEDGWRKTRVRHAIWVRRHGQGERDLSVLSSICPHLGCPVNWQPDQSRFFCPCHGGMVDAAGDRTGGPPPRAMDSLEYEVRAGRLWVRWQEFKIGVAERTPVSG